MITTTQIFELIDKSGKSVKKIGKESLVNPNSIYLWDRKRRLPRVLTLKKVLNNIGYKMVLNEIDSGKKIPLSMDHVNYIIKKKGLKKKFVAERAGVHESAPIAWAKSNHGATLVNLEAYVNVIGYTIDVEPL